MNTPESIIILRKRIDNLKEGSINYDEVMNFNSSVVIDSIIRLGENTEWWPPIKEFINSELPLSLENVRYNLALSIGNIRKAVFTTETIEVVDLDDLGFIDPDTYKEVTGKRKVGDRKLSSEEQVEIRRTIGKELDGYRECLIDQLILGRNDVVKGKIVFNKTVGQLGALIRILLDLDIIDKDQNENHSAFASIIINTLLIKNRKKAGEEISDETIKSAINSPTDADFDHWKDTVFNDLDKKLAKLRADIVAERIYNAKNRRRKNKK